MELFFLALLILTMATALAAGFPVAFALPGSAILTIGVASLAGLIFAGDVTTFFFQGGPVQWLTAGVTNFRGVYWEVERDTLIAVPLFVFMGIMLQRSKIAEDLLVTMAQLFGPIPGGLGISVVFVGALLAATTGILGATVIAMGLISLPAMLRHNYSRPLATGTIAAAGTLGQIIPPSIVLIILADQLSNATDQAQTARVAEYRLATGQFSMPSEFAITSTSAGDMFLGAIVPGLVLVALYASYILVLAMVRPRTAPAVPYEGRYDWNFAGRVFVALVPPLALIFGVLGSIILGIATVNQAGAIGAAGAIVMAGYRLTGGQRNSFYPAILAGVSLLAIFVLLNLFNLNVKNIRSSQDAIGIALAVVAVIGLITALLWSGWRTWKIDDTLRGVMVETAKTSSMVFIILMGAAMLTASFRSFGGEVLVKDFLHSLPGGFWSQFIVVMGVIFILGFFLDFIEIAVVVVPIVAPILLADPGANVTAVWLGVMIGVNMQTSFLTPPFGFALFYLRGVAPVIVKTIEIYRGVVVFIMLQLIGLGIAGTFPILVNFLPYKSFLTAETAPPPQNPRLQFCLERHLFSLYDETADDLRAAIAQARTLDVSVLPERYRKELEKGFDAAAGTFALVADVRTAAAAVEEATPDYRPLHTEVRRLQAQERAVTEQLKTETNTLNRVSRNKETPDSEVARLKQDVARLQSQKEEIENSFPAGWTEAHKQFVALTNAERRARLTYRRNVDTAYQPVLDIRTLLADIGPLTKLGPQIEALPEAVRSQSAEAAQDTISAVESALGDISGANDIRSPLTAARRELRGSNNHAPDLESIAAALTQGIATYRAELAWRKRAAESLGAGLARYDEAIRDSIGLRLQKRLPRGITSAVASCLSDQRDISLNF